jgi:basic amino acid/polyamine antiporter, APA family
VSLLVMAGTAIVFCLFRLADVVTALVVIRVVIQFLAQTLGILVLRARRPDVPRPFRMWLYPVPAILAFLGFLYVIVMRPQSIVQVRLALLVAAGGTILYWFRRRAPRSTRIG